MEHDDVMVVGFAARSTTRFGLMTSASAAPPPRVIGTSGTGYRPGTCNIGPDEIARRRRAGHVGLIATIVTLAVLLALHTSPIFRLVVFLPAAAAAIGYLQAWFRFCAGFGARGVYNFGPLGRTQSVDDPEAAARDRAMARRLALGSAIVGIVVAAMAVLLPA
jgi:hypothetical protein